MISRDWVVTMARYNTWQNRSVFGLASELTDAQRREDLGAFFKSVHATLNHILWADQMWLWRFGVCPAPADKSLANSTHLHDGWDDLCSDRVRFDGVIRDWADAFDPAWVQADLTWIAGTTGKEETRPRGVLVSHLFNHQTHHRGQVNCMLTRLGLKPGVTDIPFMPD